MVSKFLRTLCLFVSILLIGYSSRGQVTITISVTPGDTICAGTSPHFHTTTSVPGAYGHIWMINSVNTGVTTPFYNPTTVANSDTVWCVLTNVAGDTVLDTSNYIVMTVIPAVVPSIITGPDSVCMGSTITVMDSVSGGFWHSSNTGILTIDSTGLVTPVAPGQARVVYMITTGSCVDSVRLRIRMQVPAGPIMASSTTVCMDSTFFVRDTARGGIWTISDSTIASLIAPFGLFQAIFPGNATIAYNVANACGSFTESIAITVINCDTVTGLGNIITAPQTITIYPNPSTGGFTITNNIAGGESAAIHITNMFGQEIAGFSLAPGKVYTQNTTIAPGLYLVTIQNGISINTEKLVVSR